MGVGAATVGRVLSHFRTAGQVPGPRHTGRGATVNRETIRNLITATPTATSTHLANQYTATTHQPVTNRRIRQIRRGLGFRPRRQRIRPVQRTAHLTARRQWARTNRNLDWTHSVFADESYIELRNTGDIAWVPVGSEAPVREVEQPRARVTVWGAIWSRGSVFSTFQGYLNSDAYITLLNNNILPRVERFNGWTFVQDNASFHTTTPVRNWFPQHNMHLLQLPAYSPEYNPIESVWGWIKNNVRHRAPHDNASLQAAVNGAIGEVTSALLKRYILRCRTLVRQDARN